MSNSCICHYYHLLLRVCPVSPLHSRWRFDLLLLLLVCTVVPFLHTYRVACPTFSENLQIRVSQRGVYRRSVQKLPIILLYKPLLLPISLSVHILNEKRYFSRSTNHPVGWMEEMRFMFAIYGPIQEMWFQI